MIERIVLPEAAGLDSVLLTILVDQNVTTILEDNMNRKFRRESNPVIVELNRKVQNQAPQYMVLNGH